MLLDSFILIFLITLLLAVPLGAYMNRVYIEDKSFLDFLLPLERFIFKICVIDSEKPMDWKQNLTTSLAMLMGRFLPIIGCFMIIGLMKRKKYIPASLGTLQTDSVTFGIFLFAIIIILSVLSLFVIFMAGPIAEYFSFR